jgi:hypothetical protein
VFTTGVDDSDERKERLHVPNSRWSQPRVMNALLICRLQSFS